MEVGGMWLKMVESGGEWWRLLPNFTSEVEKGWRGGWRGINKGGGN